jgi:hypothetical protein
MLWNIAVMALLGAGNYLGPGCFGIPINVYSSDPTIRLEEMMIDSFNRQVRYDGVRFFGVGDQPPYTTPYRVHGGVGPASSSP